LEKSHIATMPRDIDHTSIVNPVDHFY
jgi:hypothetical protein